MSFGWVKTLHLHAGSYKTASLLQIELFMQAPEGDFVKSLVPDILRQLGAGGSSLPQQIIKMGMQGSTVCIMMLDDGQGPSHLPVQKADAIGLQELLTVLYGDGWHCST